LKIDEAGALVVTDDNRTILGLISERDIVRGLQSHGRNVVDRPVSELMTRSVVTCDVSEPLTRVLELMDKHQIHHVPILRSGVLCGIINMLDVVKNRLAEIDLEARALHEYVVGRR
jgi:CBS domain-containing protein